MTAMKKRICALLVSLCVSCMFLCTGPLCAIGAAQDDKTAYTAFGDSIAAGYGLNGYSADQEYAPKDSYQALLADFLHTESSNYAVTGDDSSACIEILQSGRADDDLQNSDIITVSVGSNDLLLPFIEILMNYFGIQTDTIDSSVIEEQLKNGASMPHPDLTDLLKYYQQSEELLSELADHPLLHEKAAAFPKQLELIINTLREKAPDAQIYVTNIYNPFASIPRIGEMAETYISEINQAFASDSKDYTLIDVYTAFHQEELTNVHFDTGLENLKSLNLDPHPSVKGHKAIAGLLIDALKDANAPKAAAITSLTGSSKVKLTIKTSLPADADGYELRYASAKGGSYKKLASVSKKTYQTNSSKLKSGKTYYIKARSYRTVKGVTYYGKNSSAKKIKIK